MDGSGIKRNKKVHAKLAEESQNTQSSKYKYLCFAVIVLTLFNFCVTLVF